MFTPFWFSRITASSYKNFSTYLPPRVTYKVTLLGDGGETIINCNDNQPILEAAEEQNINLAYFCRSGACSICLGIQTFGTPVEQSDNIFLSLDQIDNGLILTCVAYPRSDCRILVNKNPNITMESSLPCYFGT